MKCLANRQKCSCRNTSSSRKRLYNCVMTAKHKKAKGQKVWIGQEKIVSHLRAPKNYFLLLAGRDEAK